MIDWCDVLVLTCGSRSLGSSRLMLLDAEISDLLSDCFKLWLSLLPNLFHRDRMQLYEVLLTAGAH
jgi:hypothetical protein